MGQEILYCFKCQERVTSGDLDSANALRFGNRVACKKCVPDLIAGLSPKEQKELVARVQTPERRPASITPRPRPAPSTRRRTQQSPVLGWAFAGVGILVLIVVATIALNSGGPEPTREPVSKAPSKAPEESPRERTAREALAKAKSVPSSNLDGQIAAYAEAMKATEGTSHHREAKEMHEGLLDLRRKSLARELSTVEERARVTLQKEEFGSALAIFEAIRPLHAGAEWKTLVDAKVDEVRKAVDATYGPLKEKAAAARGKGAENEVKEIRDRIGRWGLAEKAAGLDAHLQGIVPAGPVRPWLPLFDGKSLDFLTGGGEGAWILENGSIVFVKGKNLSAQTRRRFTDAEIRIRFQQRDLTDLGFCFRQGDHGQHAVFLDRARLRSGEGIDHDLVIAFRGSTMSATMDGQPVPIETFGTPTNGHFQFNARGEMCVIKLIEYREDSESVGMVGYWNFDALKDGSALDSSGYGNDGKIAETPVPVAGKIGNALQFDGRRSFVSVPASESLNPTGPFTLSVWVKPSPQDGESPGLVEKWDTGGFLLRLTSKRHIHFVLKGAGEVIGVKEVPPHVWSLVTAVFDGSSLRVYMNGVLDRNLPFLKMPLPSTSPLTIGRGGGGGSHHFAGLLDDVRIYNRALSPEEISRMAAAGK